MNDFNEITCSDKKICIQNIINDNSDEEKEFICIEEFEIQFPSFLFLPFRRRNFYASD
jgi:hypothetical protein